MKRFAIIQMEAVHEEVLPSLIFIFNKLGYSPYIYINQKSIKNKGNFLSDFSFLEFTIKTFAGNDVKYRENLVSDISKDENIDFLLITTFQSDSLVDYYKSFGKPLVGIVHNAKKFVTQEKCVSLFLSKEIYLLTLSKHVSCYLNLKLDTAADNISHYLPFILDPSNSHSEKNLAIEKGKALNIGITGSVLFRDRDLMSLAESLGSYGNDSNLNFVICGGGNDREEFENLVKEKSVSNIRFAPTKNDTGYVEYSDYLDHLNQCHFLITLFNKKSTYYYSSKISSVISSSVSFSTPLIMNAEAATVYDNPGVIYHNNDYEYLFQKLNNFSDTEYQELVIQAKAHRDFVISNSITQIRRFTDRL